MPCTSFTSHLHSSCGIVQYRTLRVKLQTPHLVVFTCTQHGRLVIAVQTWCNNKITLSIFSRTWNFTTWSVWTFLGSGGKKRPPAQQGKKDRQRTEVQKNKERERSWIWMTEMCFTPTVILWICRAGWCYWSATSRALKYSSSKRSVSKQATIKQTIFQAVSLHRLVGLVVKVSAWGAEDPRFESCLCWDFFFLGGGGGGGRQVIPVT